MESATSTSSQSTDTTAQPTTRTSKTALSRPEKNFDRAESVQYGSILSRLTAEANKEIEMRRIPASHPTLKPIPTATMPHQVLATSVFYCRTRKAKELKRTYHLRDNHSQDARMPSDPNEPTSPRSNYQ